MSAKTWSAAAFVLCALVVVPVALGASKAKARADAVVAKGTPGVFRDVSARGDESQSASGPISVADVSIRSSQASATGTIGDGKGTARATAVARSVDLFNGTITAQGVRRTAEAAGGSASYSGVVYGLTVGGREIGAVTGPAIYEFDGGKVTVNTESYGLLVEFEDGRSLAVAQVSAFAEDAVRPKPTATPTATATPTPDQESVDEEKKDRKKKRPKEDDTAPPDRLIGAPGYVFPVGGQAVVADDFHGPRQIGEHQGNDIFAPFGTPVVAVADGVLHKVGTLPISGNRLWLRTDAGDEFFYAHMSSFSPRAQSRRRVEAGTVLGFVGNTGDAEPTPPHLHFEIHVGDMEATAVDPHEVLLSWQANSTSLRRFGLDPAGRPGALVEVRDFLAE